MCVGVVLILLAGCGVTPPNPSPTIAPEWKALIDQALADPALSSFQREILSDYVITDAEYGEAQNRYIQCMADQGWSVTFDGHGYSVTATPGGLHDGEQVDSATNTLCENESLSYVEPIYLAIRDNPSAVSGPMLIRECYVRNSVPDGAGLSDDAFAAMVEDQTYIPSTPQGCVCLFDPTGSNGLTPDAAVDLAQNRADTASVVVTASPSR